MTGRIQFIRPEVTGPTVATGEYGAALRARVREIVARPPRHTVLRPAPNSAAREAFRPIVADALMNWRHGTLRAPRSWNLPERAIFREGVKDLASMRLMEAYLPLLHGLARFERWIAARYAYRGDPWAPKRYSR